MGYPQGVGVVDLMIGFPFKDKKATYQYLMPGIKDTQSNTTKTAVASPTKTHGRFPSHFADSNLKRLLYMLWEFTRVFLQP